MNSERLGELLTYEAKTDQAYVSAKRKLHVGSTL